MTARLFQFYPSALCAKMRKILAYKGIAYEPVEVDFVDRAEIVALSGQMQVPVLQLADDDIIADSGRIVARLESTFPQPTLLPAVTRGLHLALTHYLETQVTAVLGAFALPDWEEYYARQGALQALFLKRAMAPKTAAAPATAQERFEAVREILAPFDETLEGKGFLLGRLGLADFALYGQLWSLTFSGTNRIPSDFSNLRAFFDRLDRLSAALEPEPA
jgi:glutathione S-transferase